MATISDDYIQHISRQLEPDQLESMLEYCQKPLRKSIRFNAVNDTDGLAKKVEQWTKAGYVLEPIPWCQEGFWIDETQQALPEQLGNYVPHILGDFYIQEASSMLPVYALLNACPRPQSVLDMAAAPGSKTTQIGLQLQHSNPETTIVANELSASRIKGLFSNIQRFGLSNVCLTHADASVFGEQFTDSFEAILLDAPCGGEGTVRKDPSALENWSLASVLAMSELQKQLILSAFHALKPGGTLVYSTCTLSQEENQDVCQHLLDSVGNEVSIQPLTHLFEGAEQVATGEGYLHLYPHVLDSEGFFIACFKKSAELTAKPSAANPKWLRNFPFARAPEKTIQAFQEHLEHFGWDIRSQQDTIWIRDQELWYFPRAIDDFLGRMRLQRIGVKLADIHKKGFKLHHQAAVAFHHHIQRQKIEVGALAAKHYIQGKDLYFDDIAAERTEQDGTVLLDKGEVLLMHQNRPLGLAKNLSSRLKNSMPRELVRDNPFIDLTTNT